MMLQNPREEQCKCHLRMYLFSISSITKLAFVAVTWDPTTSQSNHTYIACVHFSPSFMLYFVPGIALKWGRGAAPSLAIV